MRICASLGSVEDIDSNDIASADIIEIRTDVFGDVPSNILKKGQTGLISFKGDVIASMIPEGWMADVGDADRAAVSGSGASVVISSHHNFDRTPCAETIIDILGRTDGDIVKGAFAANSLSDAVALLDASRRICRKHVIIGMGELGKITRIRQERMGNEFTFAYVGKATAPGQLSVHEMRQMDDDLLITGIIGSGIGYTRSPAMHDAAFMHSGVRGKYLTFDTPSVDRADEFILGFDIRGVNVTKPYKTDIINYLDACDKISDATGAVNTVVNDNGKLKGYNTDVHGIEMALKMNGIDVRGKRALILGSGGAARSCAYFLSENGCTAAVTGRNVAAAKKIASDLSVTARERTSVAVKGYDIIVNCIPLNTENDASEYPIRIDQIDVRQTIFDMVYGRTHLNDIAERRGCSIVRGEDMLAHQGVRSFELFTSGRVPFSVMRNAV